MAMYQPLIIVTCFVSFISKDILPNFLKFGQKKQTVLHRLEKNTFAKNSRSEVHTVEDSKTLTYVNYNLGIRVNGNVAFHYTVFFLKNKLAAVQIQYNISPQLDHRVFYDSLCKRFGTPVVLSSSLGKSWVCMWKVLDNTIKLKVERTETLGDIIVLDFLSNINDKTTRDLIEKELNSVGS